MEREPSKGMGRTRAEKKRSTFYLFDKRNAKACYKSFATKERSRKKQENFLVVHTFQILHYFRRQILALLHPLQWISPTCITNERKRESVQVSDYLLPPVLRPLINYL